MKQTQSFLTKLGTKLLNTMAIKLCPTSIIATQRVSTGYGGQEKQHQKVMELGQNGASLENQAGIVGSI